MKSEKSHNLASIEGLIQQGLQARARSLLLSTRILDLPRYELVYYCSLLRRAGLSLQALRILNPLLYPKARSPNEATVEESLEYASNLIRIGVFHQAESILRNIDSKKYPLVLIRQGFLGISQWDFEHANGCFKDYIANPIAESYNILIAKVNLLQGLVNTEQFKDAEELSVELQSILDPVKHKLLRVAVYEFQSELYRIKKDYEPALEEARKGKELLDQSKTIDEFLIRKQEGIVIAEMIKNINPLDVLKVEALEKKHFESIRDLDFHSALIARDIKKLSEIYWKTKSQSYKSRMVKIAQKNNLTLNTKEFRFKRNKGIVYSLKSHGILNARTYLKRNQNLSKLLSALLSEGYRPLTVFDLFSMVYTNERFFPDSTPTKMHQLIRRLRQTLLAENIPVKVICKNERYFISVIGNFTLNEQANSKPAWEQTFRQAVREKYFDFQTAEKFWSCSRRTAARRIDDLKRRHRIQKAGNTKSAKFRFIAASDLNEFTETTK